mmetsp:Transcript_118224/g.329718  ORF Transcript_118224/g.329718 Transcript_118224/m.329718 type:complete len:232 (+) Transcript_118224:226-921(+)
MPLLILAVPTLGHLHINARCPLNQVLEQLRQGRAAAPCGSGQGLRPEAPAPPPCCCATDRVGKALVPKGVAEPHELLHLLCTASASSLAQRLHEGLREPGQQAARALALLGVIDVGTRCQVLGSRGGRDLRGGCKAHGGARHGRRGLCPSRAGYAAFQIPAAALKWHRGLVRGCSSEAGGRRLRSRPLERSHPARGGLGKGRGRPQHGGAEAPLLGALQRVCGRFWSLGGC